MRSTIAFASLLAAAACVSASSSSHPVLAFTSQQASSTKLELPSDSSISSFVDSLFSAGKASPACSLAAIALVSANNLNRETFASLRYTSSQSLRGRSLDAPSQVTFSAQPDAEYADKLVSRAREVCTARKDVIDIVRINVNDLQQEESLLLQKLEALDESHPRNLVILAQNERLHQHTKRQYVVAPSSSSGNWTEPTGGVFAKYQLFSTPLILTLLLVGGVLLPIVYFAVAQLAQIQVPDQIGVRKDPISGEKKTQ